MAQALLGVFVFADKYTGPLGQGKYLLSLHVARLRKDVHLPFQRRLTPPAFCCFKQTPLMRLIEIGGCFSSQPRSWCRCARRASNTSGPSGSCSFCRRTAGPYRSPPSSPPSSSAAHWRPYSRFTSAHPRSLVVGRRSIDVIHPRSLAILGFRLSDNLMLVYNWRIRVRSALRSSIAQPRPSEGGPVAHKYGGDGAGGRTETASI